MSDIVLKDTTMLALPRECVVLIASFLDIVSYIDFTLVCKYTYSDRLPLIHREDILPCMKRKLLTPVIQYLKTHQPTGEELVSLLDDVVSTGNCRLMERITHFTTLSEDKLYSYILHYINNCNSYNTVFLQRVLPKRYTSTEAGEVFIFRSDDVKTYSLLNEHYNIPISALFSGGCVKLFKIFLENRVHEPIYRSYGVSRYALFMHRGYDVKDNNSKDTTLLDKKRQCVFLIMEKYGERATLINPDLLIRYCYDDMNLFSRLCTFDLSSKAIYHILRHGTEKHISLIKHTRFYKQTVEGEACKTLDDLTVQHVKYFSRNGQVEKVSAISAIMLLKLGICVAYVVNKNRKA